MLSLATHEPNFRVLREDVFQQNTACRNCGQEGHYANDCKNPPAEKQTSSEPKPFIFLDVAVLREYLEVELNVPNTPFPFNFEHAIDDWVLLIFFVGNDFLPHLPSLEIREGAIDTLLKIWKQELPRMGGYITSNGELRLKSVQIIMEGLARREDDIFRRRREGMSVFHCSQGPYLTCIAVEERAASNQRENKRRKVEVSTGSGGPSAALRLTEAPSAPSLLAHPSLPAKPDFAQKADALGLGAKQDSKSDDAVATQAMAGSNRDVVANRAAIRMANMNAAEMLKAEMAGLIPVKPSKSSAMSKKAPHNLPANPAAPSVVEQPSTSDMQTEEDGDVPGFGAHKVDPTDLTLEGPSEEPSLDPKGGQSEDVAMDMNEAGGKSHLHQHYPRSCHQHRFQMSQAM
jgi:5'-3' exoribonuclease 2